MNKKSKILFFHIMLVTLVPFSVSAEWYVGADTYQKEILPYPDSISDNSLFSESITSYKSDPYDTSVSLFGGYRTTDNFSLQLEYQDELSFGIDEMFAGSSLWFPEASSESFDSNALFFTGISSYPISDSGVFYMKGGLFNWEIDSNYYETSEKYLGRTSGTDFFYGFGANYDLNTRFGISAEWERYQMEESDIDYLSTKLKFKF